MQTLIPGATLEEMLCNSFGLLQSYRWTTAAFLWVPLPSVTRREKTESEGKGWKRNERGRLDTERESEKEGDPSLDPRCTRTPRAQWGECGTPWL